MPKHFQNTINKFLISKSQNSKFYKKEQLNNTKQEINKSKDQPNISYFQPFRHLHQMLQTKQIQQKRSKLLYETHQKDYVQYLRSLLPPEFLENDHKNHQSNLMFNDNTNTLNFFTSKSIKNNRSNRSLNKSRIANVDSKRNGSALGQFLLKLVKMIAKQRFVDEYGELESITKQLGIDIKQLNKIDDSQAKIQFMMNSIDKQIEDQKKKILFGSKCQGGSSVPSVSQKPCSFTISLNNLATKENNFVLNSEPAQKFPSKYQEFIRQQNKKEVDNFAWLQINTKYPMLEKKLKSKLIQSINEDKNERRIRDLIDKKQKSKKILTNDSVITHSTNGQGQSSFVSSPSVKANTSLYRQVSYVDIEDEKIDLINESLFMEQFEKAKIDYIWTDNDEKMFVKNINELRKKCSNNSEFLKLCGRFKFISQKEFQTLACQEISRMLNKNNKIYLSREFLLDKYYSTTQTLTEQQMRFILKTSPMLSKCVDRNFIKNAIKNIKYENISDLELKIAEDIIGRFQKLRNSVRTGRKAYKQKINQVAKQRIAFFQKNKELHIAKEIARDELKNHKTHLMRALNYQKKHPSQINTSSNGLSKKQTKNIWAPLNKYHPPTGLFVKDCNQQCTDDIFNPYEKEYLKKIRELKEPPKQSIVTKAEMIKFYTGGPDQNISSNFNASESDVINICSIIKAYFFEKKILTALQSIEISNSDTCSRRDDTKSTAYEPRTKKTFALLPEEEFEIMAKKKLFENRQKAKQTVYVNKLLFLAAENSYLSLKALNPQFTPDQVNTRDKKGNTALFYASRFGNEDFVQFLLKFGSNPNVKCEKQFTPLHWGFKSNNISLVLKLLTSSFYPPNLNVLNSEFKTPLAYCSREVLKRLNLEDGVASVDPNTPSLNFDNNSLMQREQFDKIKEESLEVQGQFLKRIKQNKAARKKNSTLTSLQNMNLQT